MLASYKIIIHFFQSSIISSTVVAKTYTDAKKRFQTLPLLIIVSQIIKFDMFHHVLFAYLCLLWKRLKNTTWFVVLQLYLQSKYKMLGIFFLYHYIFTTRVVISFLYHICTLYIMWAQYWIVCGLPLMKQWAVATVFATSFKVGTYGTYVVSCHLPVTIFPQQNGLSSRSFYIK